MAVTVNQGSAAETRPLSSYTMSLTSGWDQIPPEHGGRLPAAGDLILLEVRKPGPAVIGPSGWTRLGEFPWTDNQGDERTGVAFYKIIGPAEHDPVFLVADGEPEWEIHGHAITGYAPVGDGVTGSATTPRGLLSAG